MIQRVALSRTLLPNHHLHFEAHLLGLRFLSLFGKLQLQLVLSRI
jgi:hypothetical protein